MSTVKLKVALGTALLLAAGAVAGPAYATDAQKGPERTGDARTGAAPGNGDKKKPEKLKLRHFGIHGRISAVDLVAHTVSVAPWRPKGADAVPPLVVVLTTETQVRVLDAVADASALAVGQRVVIHGVRYRDMLVAGKVHVIPPRDEHADEPSKAPEPKTESSTTPSTTASTAETTPTSSETPAASSPPAPSSSPAA